MWWTRLRALIVKELLAVLRDPKSRIIIIVPPIIQLVVFSFAATLEVRNVDVMVLNRDAGRWGHEIIRRIEGAPTFRSITHAASPDELRKAIDEQTVLAAIQISPTFSRDIEAARRTDIQIILDGRRSNAAQIVGGYLNQIVNSVAAETPAGQRAAPGVISVVPRNWFNPNLEFRWFMVPNLVGAIALLIGLILTALSIARERELGTFDQLMVSPLRTHEILIGKLTPPMLIGLFHITVYVLAAVFIFGIPLRGSLSLLYGSAIFFLASAGNENASFGLVGSQRGWSGAEPGRLARNILRARIANPIVVVDEIEKAGTATSTRGQAYGLPEAMLPLMEPLTARRWSCPYYQVPFDMSWVGWILTSNTAALLPEPFRSRCPPIQLRHLTASELSAFVRREGAKRDLSETAIEAMAEVLTHPSLRDHHPSLRIAARMLQRASDLENAPILH